MCRTKTINTTGMWAKQMLPGLKICSFTLVGRGSSEGFVTLFVMCINMEFDLPVVGMNCTTAAFQTCQLSYIQCSVCSTSGSPCETILYYLPWLLPEVRVSQGLTELLQWFSFVTIHVGAESWKENHTRALSLHPSVCQLWKVWSRSILNRGLVPPVT